MAMGAARGLVRGWTVWQFGGGRLWLDWGWHMVASGALNSSRGAPGWGIWRLSRPVAMAGLGTAWRRMSKAMSSQVLQTLLSVTQMVLVPGARRLRKGVRSK